MRLHRAILSCLVVGPALLAPAALAQSPDSVAFHRGQWGTEFTIGNGFVAAGLLHFRTPTRAVLIDIGANYDRTSYGYATLSGNTAFTNVTLRIGTRAYRSVERRLYRMMTVGITATYSRRHEAEGTTSSDSEGYGGGAFADIGATWLVTPHLGIGAKFGATVEYFHAEASGPRTNEIHFSLGNVTLAGQLYF